MNKEFESLLKMALEAKKRNIDLIIQQGDWIEKIPPELIDEFIKNLHEEMSL